MTNAETNALLVPGEEAGYAVDALLHLLQMAAWEMCQLSVGTPATKEQVALASTIDRTVELVRKTHQIEHDAISAAALAYGREAGE